jgi:hypothetical protein
MGRESRTLQKKAPGGRLPHHHPELVGVAALAIVTDRRVRFKKNPHEVPINFLTRSRGPRFFVLGQS